MTDTDGRRKPFQRGVNGHCGSLGPNLGPKTSWQMMVSMHLYNSTRPRESRGHLFIGELALH